MNILITGASKGIGKAIAMELASKGYHLALCARELDALKSLEDEILAKYSIKVFSMLCDCSKKSELENFVFASENYLGSIDVLINNVGTYQPSFILEETDDVFISQFQLNVLSAYYLYKVLGNKMKNANKGYIFNICSIASLEAISLAGSYCVTKAAMLSLNNVMREELKDFGVKVTAILPGATYTHSWDGTQIPQEKFVQPSAIAKAISTALSFTDATYYEQLIIKPLTK